MRLIYSGVCVSAALLLSAGVAQGQRALVMGVGGGASFTIGPFNDRYATGFNGLVSVGFGSAEAPMGIRFDAMYSQFDSRTGTASPGDTRLFAVIANLIYAMPGNTVKPYVVGGAGNYQFKNTGAKSTTDFGVSGGAGLTFGLTQFSAFIEARVHSVNTSSGRSQFIPVTFGVLF